jgi:hypothetical protein
MNIATLVMVGVYMLLLIAVRPFRSLEDMVSAAAHQHVRAHSLERVCFLADSGSNPERCGAVRYWHE